MLPSPTAEPTAASEGGILREQVLVLSDRGDESARLGMPVDRIVGLVDGAAASSPGADPVAERRSIDGRVVFVLDPRRLVARAAEAIESSLQRAD